MTSIIAIEGLDGAGKTTLCSRLVQLFGSENRVLIGKSPHKDIEALAYDARSSAGSGSLCAFAMANIYFGRLAASKKIAIVDRYLLSTLVHHNECINRFGQELDAVLSQFRFQVPMLNVLLDVDIALAKNRLLARESDKALIVSLDDQNKRFNLLPTSTWQKWIGPTILRNSNTAADLEANVEFVTEIILKTLR